MTEEQALRRLAAMCSKAEHSSGEVDAKMRSWQMDDGARTRVVPYINAAIASIIRIRILGQTYSFYLRTTGDTIHQLFYFIGNQCIIRNKVRTFICKSAHAYEITMRDVEPMWLVVHTILNIDIIHNIPHHHTYQ